MTYIQEPFFIQNTSWKPDSRLKSWKSESGNDFADLWQLLTFISAFIFQTRSAAAIMCSPSYQYWNQLISCAACCACWKTNDEKDFFRDLRQASGNVLLSGLVGTYWVQSQTQILPSSYHMCIASCFNSAYYQSLKMTTLSKFSVSANSEPSFIWRKTSWWYYVPWLIAWLGVLSFVFAFFRQTFSRTIHHVFPPTFVPRGLSSNSCVL